MIICGFDRSQFVSIFFIMISFMRLKINGKISIFSIKSNNSRYGYDNTTWKLTVFILKSSRFAFLKSIRNKENFWNFQWDQKNLISRTLYGMTVFGNFYT